HASQAIRDRISELIRPTLVTSEKLHKRWSDMFEADIADIIQEDGHYKPIHQWPKVWRQMLSGMDVKQIYERSADGKASNWDRIGEIVKLRFIKASELGDLLGRHRAVDAFVRERLEEQDR